MLAALRNETADPDATDEVMDELHVKQTTGAILLGDALHALIDARKSLKVIEAIAKAIPRS